MPVANWEGQLISAEEFDRLEAMYHPLAHAVRQLIDATVRTGADEPTIRAAAEAIDAVTESLKPLERRRVAALRHAETGRPILFTNPAAGGRNPVAPPMVIHHEPDGRCWSEFTSAPPMRVRPAWRTAASAHCARPPARRGRQWWPGEAPIHRRHHHL